MGTQIASTTGEPLELVNEDVKLSYHASHFANQRKSRLSHTLELKFNESDFSLCQNRFEPLMGLDSTSNQSINQSVVQVLNLRIYGF